MDRILLKNCQIWSKRHQTDILIDGQRIAKIESKQNAANHKTIDLSGKTVLPGFFNAHVHLYGVNGPLPDGLLQRFVTGGCTTVRDMGMTSERDFTEYMRWLSTRQGPDYPKIIPSGKFLCGKNTFGAIHPSGTQVGYIIDETEEGAARAVDVMVDSGAQLIKTGLDDGADEKNHLDYLSEKVFRAICRRAKERGIPSTAHVTKRDDFVKAARWSLTECAHTPTNALSEEDIVEVVKTGMAFCTTASIFDFMASQRGKQVMNDIIDNIGRLYSAGISMSVGTDYMFEAEPYQTAGIPIHELQLLYKAGLSVEEIVKASTIDTANIIGVGRDLGSIEVGRIADIIATDSEIDSTFSALSPEHIVFVMHYGTIVVNRCL